MPNAVDEEAWFS